MNCRKWIWLGLWIFSLVGISFHGGAVSYGFFFMLTLLPVVSFIYLLCVFLRFKIYQEVESRDMVCGQAMPYFFVLQNEDYFGFASVNVKMFADFSYVENVAEDMEYELLPGDKFIYRTRIICKYRGEYEVGVKEVVVTDFFRIFRLKYPVSGTIKALVKPKITELEELLSLPEMAESLPKEAFWEKNEPDVVVRDYIFGDSLRRVHWKTTARMQQLKVRKDTWEEKQGITLFFDTKRQYRKIEAYLPVESKMLEVLLALGFFFAKRNMSFSVYYERRGCRTEVSNIKGFQAFYEEMSELSFDSEEELLGLLGNLYGELGSSSLKNSKAVIGIVHKLSDELLQFTERLSNQGSMVLLYVISDENLEEYMRQSTPRRKIVVIPTEKKLEGGL